MQRKPDVRPSLTGISLAVLLILGMGIRAGISTTLPELPDLTSYLMVRTGANQQQTAHAVEEVADALKDYDVILFGEWHDHPANHLAEMALLRALHARNARLALSLEQFERDVQPILDDYLAGTIGEDLFRSRGRAWRNYAESYRPLVEYAKERKLPVIAAQVPAAIARCVGQEGPEYLSRLGPDRRGWAAAQLHLGAGAYRDKFFRFLDEDGSHGEDDEKALDASGQPTATALRRFAAQATRDDTMAESITLFLQKNTRHKVMHVTGAFHVAGFLGTAERVKMRAPHLKVAVINPVQVNDPEHPVLSADDADGGTFTLLLKATPKKYANEAEQKAAQARIRAQIRGAAQRSNCAE